MRSDPIELEIFKNIYHSIAEEMGAALRRTAFSPNIKERRDYSCAIFDAHGEVIAMGDHMVGLGQQRSDALDLDGVFRRRAQKNPVAHDALERAAFRSAEA